MDMRTLDWAPGVVASCVDSTHQRYPPRQISEVPLARSNWNRRHRDRPSPLQSVRGNCAVERLLLARPSQCVDSTHIAGREIGNPPTNLMCRVDTSDASFRANLRRSGNAAGFKWSRIDLSSFTAVFCGACAKGLKRLSRPPSLLCRADTLHTQIDRLALERNVSTRHSSAPSPHDAGKTWFDMRKSHTASSAVL